MKTTNASMHNKRMQLFEQLLKEQEKKEENKELLFRACSNINSET